MNFDKQSQSQSQTCANEWPSKDVDVIITRRKGNITCANCLVNSSKSYKRHVQ